MLTAESSRSCLVPDPDTTEVELKTEMVHRNMTRDTIIFWTSQYFDILTMLWFTIKHVHILLGILGKEAIVVPVTDLSKKLKLVSSAIAVRCVEYLK